MAIIQPGNGVTSVTISDGDMQNTDGSLIDVDGNGGEAPEMGVDYYDSQIAFHEQVVANLEAQKQKVEEFLANDPENH